MTFFLGVDGGGSKTAFALINDSGELMAETQSPSTYYFSEGIGLVGRVLSDGVEQVCRQAGIRPDEIERAFFGLPGYGEVSDDLEGLDAIPRRFLGHDRYSCDNDMVCGWAGSLGGADGINIISGTGSMTYGERRGRGRRVGGWGELFGDEGSAYWIATRGLNAFSKMSDGRMPRGPLYDLIKERMGILNDLDVIDVVFNRWQAKRGSIADLSKTVVLASGHGDTVATGILTEACAELASIVDGTRRELGFGDDELVPVSYSGGMFTVEAMRVGFAASLAELYPRYELRTPLFGPAIGAALYAAMQAGHPLAAEHLLTLQRF